MILFMRHVEVHVLEVPEDIDGAVEVGLVELDDLDGSQCAVCSERIAHVDGAFVPFAVVLDETDEQWLVCEECVTDAIENRYALGMFDAEEEFEDDDDNFYLTDD